MEIELFGSFKYDPPLGPYRYGSLFGPKEIHPFPLNHLPIIVRIKVVRSLEYKDCFNLAMASRKASKIVKSARIRATILLIQISDTASFMIYGSPNRKSVAMEPDEIKSWVNEQNESIAENVVKIYKNVHDLFLFEFKFGLVFYDDCKNDSTIRKVLTDPTLKNWGYCSFYGETFDRDDLKTTLDMAAPDRNLLYFAKEIPADFRHENAFKFDISLYNDACWVQIEDLYGIRNCEKVTLERTHFTHSQIKDFINFWISSQVDMFGWMKIRTSETIIFDDLFDGLLVVYKIKPGSSTVFTLSKSSFEVKKPKLLSINYCNGNLILNYWKDDSFVPRRNENKEDIKKFQNCREILEILTKKKELEGQMGTTEDKDRPGLLEEIKDSVDKLTAFNVYFEDGKAILT